MTAIFDMDGTLIDSSKILSNSINYVRAYLGLKPLEKDFILKNINDPNANLAKIFYEKDEINRELYSKFREYYDANHQSELILFDGMRELLEGLKKDGIKLAVATNAYKATTIATLNHIKIADIFDELISFEDVGVAKPEPNMLFEITKRLNSQKPIFIGDSDNDYLAAKNAKIPFIYVDFINKRKDINSIEALENNLKSFFRV